MFMINYYYDGNDYSTLVELDFPVMPYFKAHELATRDTSEIRLDTYLCIHLPWLRHTWGKPLILNSACRTTKHNADVGGNVNSFHLMHNPKYNTTGCAAVDIAWKAWSEEKRKDFVALVAELGWNYGTASTFIHIDRGQDHGKPPLTWTY